MRGATALLVVALGAWAGPGVGQQTAAGDGSSAPVAELPAGPVLTIEPDRLFQNSLFGQRIAAEVLAATESLAAENRQIEATLTDEEKSLTRRRPTMAVEDFRVEAEAFDSRVQDIRREQDAKESALADLQTSGRDQFLSAATPVLGRLMIDLGASVILDRRSVFLSIGSLDVTDEAVVAIDAAIGDGSDAASADPSPVTAVPAEPTPDEDPGPPDSTGPVPADPPLAAPSTGD